MFDHIYSVNVVQFWNEPEKVFTKIHDLLTSNGIVASMFMPPNKGATNKQAFKMGDKIKQWLHQAGFENIQVETREFDDDACVCVIGGNAI